MTDMTSVEQSTPKPTDVVGSAEPDLTGVITSPDFQSLQEIDEWLTANAEAFKNALNGDEVYALKMENIETVNRLVVKRHAPSGASLQLNIWLATYPRGQWGYNFEDEKGKGGSVTGDTSSLPSFQKIRIYPENGGLDFISSNKIRDLTCHVEPNGKLVQTFEPKISSDFKS